MATRPRELSRHAAGQVRSVCALRRQAARITADIDSMFGLLLEQVERYGWDAQSVVKGLAVAEGLQRDRDKLLHDAERLECEGMRV